MRFNESIYCVESSFPTRSYRVDLEPRLLIEDNRNAISFKISFAEHCVVPACARMTKRSLNPTKQKMVPENIFGTIFC